LRGLSVGELREALGFQLETVAISGVFDSKYKSEIRFENHVKCGEFGENGEVSYLTQKYPEDVVSLVVFLSQSCISKIRDNF
jgi:hypothetical protein